MAMDETTWVKENETISSWNVERLMIEIQSICVYCIVHIIHCKDRNGEKDCERGRGRISVAVSVQLY